MDQEQRSRSRQPSTRDIPPNGLTVLVEPDSNQVSLDIVFVHGFNGHPERTWSHKRGDARVAIDDSESSEPPQKSRKLNPFSRPQQKNSTGSDSCYWPQHLVHETIPNTRILTFGYDTRVKHFTGPPVSKNTVYDIAWDFLVALEAERRVEEDRPIFFIAHSLGGIVVKEMLRRSESCQKTQTQLHAVFKSTIGIIFFGTPHGGADPRGFLQHVAESAFKAAGFQANEQIVDTLLPSSERLRELRDEFGPLALQERWMIHSFQESLGMGILGGKKVVEDVSSCLHCPAIEIIQHIGRDHREMCRFTGPDDIEYKKVAAALRRITGAIVDKPRREIPSLPEEQKHALMASLKFDQIDARQATIKQNHSKTCRWMIKMPEYINWLDSNQLVDHNGFLWIKGKPGTGKSTIMKFISTQARKAKKGVAIVSFFFNARGGDLEKSTDGMYRSLLLQILEKMPDLQDLFSVLGTTALSSIGSYVWTLETLKNLLQQAIQRLGQRPLTCFIDALDECEERQIRDMISFFEQVGETTVLAGIQFRVCFSSRHYPHITISKGLHLVLEGQEGHNNDITNYVDSELKIGHGKLAEEIRGELREKSSGIFMWVVLVVEILNKENDGGRVHVLRRKLRELPSDLHELFRQILVRDHHNKDELLLCLQWILFAKRPLKLQELYFALLSGASPADLDGVETEEITTDVMKKFILDSSKGLAEATKSTHPTVQFIHESVRDFLVKENGLDQIFPERKGCLKGQSHKRLTQCCSNYMKIDITGKLGNIEPLPKASSEEAKVLRNNAREAFPFLDYAVQHVFYHADTAQSCSSSQEEFLSTFPLSVWIKLHNLFEKFEIRQYTPKASLLYILAELNASNLIRILPDRLSYFETEDERYGLPLFAAMANGSLQVVQTFVDLEIKSNPESHELRNKYSLYRYGESTTSLSSRDVKFSKHRTKYSYVHEIGDGSIWTFLRDIGKLTLPDSGDKNLQASLVHAAKKGYIDILKHFFETNLEVADSKYKVSGRSPVSYAAESGRLEAIKLLLGTGKVDIDSRDNKGRTPLSWAAERNREEVVQLLLATGKADIDSRDNKGRTPLSWAAMRGTEKTVQLLLATGKVDIDSRDNKGRTPLSWAAMRGTEKTVQLLLATGKVDIDSRDNEGRTPLSRAAGYCFSVEAMRLLLATGKVNPESRDHNGRTPLWYAVSGLHTSAAVDIISMLLATKRVDPCAADNSGVSPLSKLGTWVGDLRDQIRDMFDKYNKQHKN